MISQYFFLVQKLHSIHDYLFLFFFKVSGALIDDKKTLRLVANLKKEFLEYTNSDGLANVSLDKIRKYKTELLTFDPDKMVIYEHVFSICINIVQSINYSNTHECSPVYS